MGIPNRIIQVWGQGEEALPLFSKASIINSKLTNPDFEFLFFDNERIEAFVDRQFPEYRKLLNSFRMPIQRYDFFRYLAIYHLGGIYLDLDIFLVSGLSNLLRWDCVFTFEELTLNTFIRRNYRMDWEIANYAFGAIPGHPFIKAIIENCVRAHEDPKWLKPMLKSIPWMIRDDFYAFYATGPGLVTRTLAENPEYAKQIEILFPDDVCDETKWHRFGEYGIHLQLGTWIKRKGIVRRVLLRRWMSWKRNRLLKSSLKLGPGRTL